MVELLKDDWDDMLHPGGSSTLSLETDFFTEKGQFYLCSPDIHLLQKDIPVGGNVSNKTFKL